MSEKVYRTAIYARLSKEDGDKAESNSIQSQKSMCEEFIRNHPDLELVDTYTDDGYSGVDFNRPDFKRMEKDMREGKINALVCKDFSRISRNYIDGGRYLEKIFPQLGIRVMVINDNYDSLNKNCQSDSITIPFKNLINDSYCKDISVKIRSNLNIKRRKGDYVGSFVPFGYMKDPENRNKIMIDEEAAAVVKEIFSLYKDGMSVLNIAEHLNGTGVPSPMGYKVSTGSSYKTPFALSSNPKWSYKAVKRILTNEIYIGILIQGKRGTPNYKVHDIEVKDEEEWVRVEDSHKPIVSYDDFQTVQTMLERDTKMSSCNPEGNIFSGFLFCADCGQPMSLKTVPSGKKNYNYFVCSSHKYRKECSSHCISEKLINSTVTHVIQDQVADVLSVSEALEYINRLPDSPSYDYEAQITRLEEEIESIKDKKLGLYESYTDGVIDKNEYTDFRNRYTESIHEKEAAVERIKKESHDASICGNAGKVWVSLFKEHEGIDELNRRVLMALVDKIFIGNDKHINIRFRYADEYSGAAEYLLKHADLIEKAPANLGRAV